jgi:hypothetical protein
MPPVTGSFSKTVTGYPSWQSSSGRQTCRTGADHRDLFLSPFLDFGNGSTFAGELIVCEKAMEVFDGNGFIQIPSGAYPFAGMVAHTAADGREGVGFLEKLQGFAVLALVDQGDVTLHAHVGGAGGLAGCRSSFLDRIGARHGLRVEFVSGLALAQFFIKAVGDIDGAGLRALAAGCALAYVDVAGLLEHLDFEIPGSPLTSTISVRGKGRC